ncbi:PRTRC genetic system protein E [Bacteroides zoogleoformans]|uniref:ParB-related ThiF-related cassette protein E domain-containing protein n=1 Tax=Bacteroides zoogleoformans TaxID=28119 RepID=A0ABN5IKA3_9BACE|nr:PRTRC system protein E [Bacteroides zoogleoformans]AVM53289.1 hypothetical protein C4H11_10435 [Bacteroides zoogleoformans]TWJ14388.1 PRTRC genetic system protein E [Bacteroides zoogleoformans]
MFTKFASMLGDGDSLSITITKKGDNLITSILPKKADLSDTGKDHLSPLVVSGTPEELEDGFIDAVITPIQQATGILTNMREFEKGVEDAEANSKAAKKEKERKEKEKKERKDKYKEFTEKANAAEKAGNIAEAIKALQEADKYASGNHSAISGRIQRLQSRLNTGTLFGGEALPPEEEAHYGEDESDDNEYSEEKEE